MTRRRKRMAATPILPRNNRRVNACAQFLAAALWAASASAGAAEPTLTAVQGVAISSAADALGADDALSERLSDAESIEDALVTLADYEERAERGEQSRHALDLAREALQEAAPGANSPADTLDSLAPTSYPALQEQLKQNKNDISFGYPTNQKQDVVFYRWRQKYCSSRHRSSGTYQPICGPMLKTQDS